MNDFKENEYTTIGYRIQELRKDKGWNQKELAEKLFVNRSQISRPENNETTNVNTAMLISIAKLFHVSTDYLLGLTPIKVPKSYDISQLGLSEKAVRRIFLNASKLSQNEADIEKIKTIFMGILRDVKSDMAGNQPTGAIMTAEISQELFPCCQMCHAQN